jgi:hypothetical protein
VTRCRSTIDLGGMATRCRLEEGHGSSATGQWFHQGRGLPQFPYQRIDWMPGDRRETESDRDDEFAWEKEEEQ